MLIVIVLAVSLSGNIRHSLIEHPVVYFDVRHKKKSAETPRQRNKGAQEEWTNV